MLAHRAGSDQKPLLWSSCLQCTQLSAGSTAVHMAHSCLYGMQLSPWCTDICKLLTGHTALCVAHSCLRVRIGMGMNIWLRAVSGCASVYSYRILAAPFLPKQIRLNTIQRDLFKFMLFLRRGWNSGDLQHLSHQGHSSYSPWASWSLGGVCAGGCQALQIVSHQLLTCLWMQIT